MFLLLVFSLLTLRIDAQIKIRTEDDNNQLLNKAIVYDSLNNFGNDEQGRRSELFFALLNKKFDTKTDAINSSRRVYQQFIGQQVLILPKSKRMAAFDNMYSTDEYAYLRGRYYTIADIEYEIEEDYFTGMFKLDELTFLLDNGEKKKTKWTISPLFIDNHALIVGFYEKLKSLYLNTVFVYKERRQRQTKDVKTGELVGLKGESWNCSDIQLVDNGLVVQLYAILTNENGNEILATFGAPLYDELDEDPTSLHYFMKKSDFMKRVAMLSEKFGEEDANLIINNQIRIGMSKEMCLESWGEPIRISRITNSERASEQWIYGPDIYLVFVGNVLSEIHN